MTEWMKKEPANTSDETHFCSAPYSFFLYGPAIDDCQEDVDGYLFISNGEYGSQVNYCPICGYKAKKAIGE